MDERFVRKLLIPSCVILVLSMAFVYELKYLVDLFFFKKKHILVIGILSAPENFQQRLSIRKTWLQLLSETSGSAYFIIGNEICGAPPYDRADPYTCVYKPFDLPETDATADTEFTTMKIKSKSISQSAVPSFTGFSFYVRSSIEVKKLGILKELLLVINTEIQVKLVSAFDNRVLASVTFNRELVNETTSPVVTKAIRPVKLNAYYEAFVKLDTKTIANKFIPKCDIAAWQSQPYVINFIQLWREHSVIPEPFTEKSCTFLLMTYTVIDAKNIKQETSNRFMRLKEWQRLNRKLSMKLDDENKHYNDIVFVDVIDVYRNLSMKMTHFFKRIIEKEYFHYLLKADDDSFVDILRVHNQLRTVNREMEDEIMGTLGPVKETGSIAKLRSSKLWWWSFFKEFWKVERAGKWREDLYRSASYPMFPCGGGYVINKGIVEYIAGNSQYLQHFQGEDVSLGIWLSPLPVNQYKVPNVITESNSCHLQKQIVTKFKGRRYWDHFNWNKTNPKQAPNMCEWTCDRKISSHIPSCNKVQLSVRNMYATWNDYTTKGFV